jgi:hypothetical protein
MDPGEVKDFLSLRRKQTTKLNAGAASQSAIANAAEPAFWVTRPRG